jgi:membrane-associated phospholipid phosphatase
VWTSERIAIAYFGYLAIVCWLRPVSIGRRVVLAAIAAFEIAAIVWIADGGILYLRQWAPVATILIGYYASGLLFVAPSPAVEAWLMAWDRRLLGDPATRFARWPRPILAALEIAYMGCFVLIGGGLIILLFNGHAAAADRYWTLVVGAEFGSFAPLAFIQTRPPWAVERKPVLADRAIHDLATQMVEVFTIRANTFPSGHVAGSLAVAIAVAGAMPIVGALLIAVAVIIGVATVVGRYHYVLDGLAGMLLALALWAIVSRA